MKKYLGWLILGGLAAAAVVAQYISGRRVQEVMVFADPGNKDDAAIRKAQSLTSTAIETARNVRNQLGMPESASKNQYGFDALAASLLGIQPSTLIGSGLPQVITNTNSAPSIRPL